VEGGGWRSSPTVSKILFLLLLLFLCVCVCEREIERMKVNVKPIPLKLRQKTVETTIECGTQMTMLLNCYVENDFGDAACRQALKGLVECMKTTKVGGDPFHSIPFHSILFLKGGGGGGGSGRRWSIPSHLSSQSLSHFSFFPFPPVVHPRNKALHPRVQSITTFRR